MLVLFGASLSSANAIIFSLAVQARSQKSSLISLLHFTYFMYPIHHISLHLHHVLPILKQPHLSPELPPLPHNCLPTCPLGSVHWTHHIIAWGIFSTPLMAFYFSFNKDKTPGKTCNRGQQTFSSKGLYNKYFRFSWPYSLCCNFSTLLLQWKTATNNKQIGGCGPIKLHI